MAEPELVDKVFSADDDPLDATLKIKKRPEYEDEIEVYDFHRRDMTLLHLACQEGLYMTAQWILSRGRIYADKPTKSGWTPIMMACETGNVELIELLIDKAGEEILDYVCKSGTPLHAAIIGQNPGQVMESILDVVEESSVISLEELVNRKDLDGIHPLYLAVHSGNTELT